MLENFELFLNIVGSTMLALVCAFIAASTVLAVVASRAIYQHVRDRKMNHA